MMKRVKRRRHHYSPERSCMKQEIDNLWLRERLSKLMETKLPNWLLSSTGEGLALKIKGLLITLIPIFILAGKSFGWEWTQEGWAEFIEKGSGAISGVVIFIGVARQFFYKKNKLGRYAN